MIELTKTIEETGIEQKTGTYIKDQFLPFFEQAEEWKEKAKTLVVTDESQTDKMRLAREARLALKAIRVNADKTRKALKEESLRYGRAVQGVYNVIEYLISPIESHLEQQEKFAEIQKAKRKEALRERREAEIADYTKYIPDGIDFGNMNEENFKKILNGARLQKKAEKEEAERIKAERIAKEKAEAEERERIRVENERLRKEAEAREKEITEERAKVEAERKKREAIANKEREEVAAKLRAEEEARARLERVIKERQKIEAEAREREEEAKRKAEAAPDKAKLLEFCAVIDGLQLPNVSSEEGQRIIASTRDLLVKVSSFIRKKAEDL